MFKVDVSDVNDQKDVYDVFFISDVWSMVDFDTEL